MRWIALLLGLTAMPAFAQADYGNWPPHLPRFESTSGGGVIISDYDPIVLDDRCVTPFTVTLPDGQSFRNIVIFQAMPVQGGILCTRARWTALDRSSQGTSPYEVFIRDGVARRSP